MADRKISDLTALTAPAAGDYLPIVDISEVAAASKNKRITIEELFRGAPDGTAAAPAIAPESDPNTGIYSSGADQLSIATNGTERLRIDSAGQIEAVSLGTAAAPTFSFTGDPNTGIYSPGADQLAISTGGTGRLFVTSAGLVGIGISTPLGALHLAATYPLLYFTDTDATGLARSAIGSQDGNLSYFANENNVTGGNHIFLRNGATESARIDSSGRLGLGTSSPQTLLQAVGAIESRSSNTYRGLRLEAQDSGFQILKAHNYLGAGYNSQIQFQTMDGTSVTTAATIDHLGRVGIGTTSPTQRLQVTDGTLSNFYVAPGYNSGSGTLLAVGGSEYLAFATNGLTNERVRIDSSGRVGIGTVVPSELLMVNGATPAAALVRTSSASGNALIKFNADETNYAGIGLENTALVMRCSNSSTPTERARIDSSGRLLVGTSTATNNIRENQTLALVAQGTNTYAGLGATSYAGATQVAAPMIDFNRSRGTTVGTMTSVASGDRLGWLSFRGADGTAFQDAAAIYGEVDGTPGSGDMPGRLVFSTTADGAASPTERMRITSGGVTLFNKTTATLDADDGVQINADGRLDVVSEAALGGIVVSRPTTDGTLITFRHAGDNEGSISVSGTTVSYNGAHLSRWSQLPGGAERTEILRGTVLSNIDEMCEWGNEDNEQLNRMKVSDIEGDKNVSGVFQAWDDDDDTYTNDFYCAMTGDFIIRIAGDVTVERGDLLMSAGDGTAKPQDDDIIRSKTIAKVTSTNVSCTYDDGSYCVPCVLMAC
jgi:hypothetical protein